ncbi:MAG: hypothetical protein CTY22_00795 [Methylomonas sp.]|nr:MAG: hypothetical protein CTY22_00795 [Methylomonas sp.]PPD40082.1 MAG: hypothetical protein CTY21_00790 [Methylomonas sp.]PPD54297.1 MAG: hypothetical protein CTY11_04010 [Methylomonas sp.]
MREGISQLLADKPRLGCPGIFTAEQICPLLAVACETPPEHLSHWTQPELARTAIERGIVDTISPSSFPSIEVMNQRIQAFIAFFNDTLAKPFRWTYIGEPLLV